MDRTSGAGGRPPAPAEGNGIHAEYAGRKNEQAVPPSGGRTEKPWGKEAVAGGYAGGAGSERFLHSSDFAGAGATVPLTGFGYNLAKGAIEGVKQSGIVGAFTGGVKAAAGGIAAAVFFGYLASLISKPKMKKQ